MINYGFKDDRQICPYCKAKCTEQLQNGIEYDTTSNCYGDFEHICPECGAVGTENFGHGIHWDKHICK